MNATANSPMRQCPLCEGNNNCQQASKESCWCMNEQFPTATLEHLQKLPQPARCICKACLASARLEQTHAG